MDLNTPELDTLIADMFATMYAANGVGLAANQVGVDMKIFVYDFQASGATRSWGVVCNPIIEVMKDGPGDQHSMKEHHGHRQPQQVTQSLTEGCLSYPGISAPVSRPRSITLRGVDQGGSPLEIQAEGHLAQILQHETDHLNGIVYGDHVPKDVRARMDKNYQSLVDKTAYPEDWPVGKAEHKWAI